MEIKNKNIIEVLSIDRLAGKIRENEIQGKSVPYFLISGNVFLFSLDL